MRIYKLLTVAVLGLGLAVQTPTALASNHPEPPTSISAEESPQGDTWFYRSSEDLRHLEIKVSSEYKFEIRDDGGVDVIDKDSGKIKETLPTTAVNKEGQDITFQYTIDPNNVLQVAAANENGYILEGGAWDSWGRCAAGTVGGTMTGGISGAASGATIGALGGPWGVGAGAIGGGIVGGIGGGLTGAAASC
ncbi:hypothetical protein [Corynebacterium freiburgense]|uniref:hypothetical protein n=1 Tax=Corynebacterium freiburgense TaxID=556548 RepID=UPI00041351E0|nr:hypothetical protein [Corynebacterium freiburgense]WJZ01590.1 hypothetical protein CFREI_01410 [Corynebacterium freiburgense]